MDKQLSLHLLAVEPQTRHIPTKKWRIAWKLAEDNQTTHIFQADSLFAMVVHRENGNLCLAGVGSSLKDLESARIAPNARLPSSLWDASVPYLLRFARSHKARQWTWFRAVDKNCVARLAEGLAHGLDPNYIEGGKSLLQNIVDGKHPENHRMADMILDAGGKVDLRTRYKNTALMCAASQHDLGMVRHLLARGADPNLKIASGLTPVMLACMAVGSYDPATMKEVVMLLLDGGADPDYVRENGNSLRQLRPDWVAEAEAKISGRALDRATPVGATAHHNRRL